MRGLDGKVAVVTGGGNGIGLAISRRLAEEGCGLGILDIDPTAARAACAAIESIGGKAVPMVADITDQSAVKAAIDEFSATGHTIDILVNNAGWDRFGPFVSQPQEVWRRAININLIGMMNVIQVALPAMIARGGGRVVNIASDAGRVGSAGESAYAAAKGGVIAFTKSIAREVASKSISVNVVCPGPTETNMMADVIASSSSPEKLREALLRIIPMRRFGQPADIVGLVAFLSSDDAAYITGQVMSVSGGLTMNG